MGRAVYISGDRDGELFEVRLADPHDSAKMPAVGIVVRKPSDTECVVQTDGLIRDVFSGLSVNKTFKVATGGGLAELAPSTGPGGYSMVQFIGLSVASDVFQVRPDMQMKIRRAG